MNEEIHPIQPENASTAGLAAKNAHFETNLPSEAGVTASEAQLPAETPTETLPATPTPHTEPEKINTEGKVFDKATVQKLNKKMYKFLSTVLIILAIFLAATLLFPVQVSIILNTLWIALIALVIIFFSLGFLVILGMKKEASRILDILLEGSLTIVDFVHFVKEVWRRFIALLKDFLVFAAPIFAYICGFIIYVLVMLLYKNVGRRYDVTAMTIILSFFMVLIFGFIAKPDKVVREIKTWRDSFKVRFKLGFIDGLEVVLFVFFLTMDSTNLFFLPAELNVQLHARLGVYDLMVRGIEYKDHFRFTLNVVTIAIGLEILRNAIRIVVLSRDHYRKLLLITYENAKPGFVALVKNALRITFKESRDDLIKFITYTTVLVLVFLLFPKLKLITLVVAGIANLILDLLITDRMKIRKNVDLISRLLGKIFRFN